MHFRPAALLPFLSAFVIFLQPALAAKAPFTIDDYFKLKRITELALSSDGEMMAYAIESQSLDENKTVRTVYVSATVPDARPILIDKLQDAKSLAWVPGVHELAYRSSDDGVTQLYSLNMRTRKVRRHTRGPDSVTAFQFAPDGETLAWLTQSSHDGTSSQALPENSQLTRHDLLFHGQEGVVIDSENMDVYAFVDPDRPNYSGRPQNTLWLKRAGVEPNAINIPGHVRTFYWSSDASKLSIAYVAGDIPTSGRFVRYTSLGILDVATGQFRTFAWADAPAPPERASLYSGGEWAPGKNALYIRRTIARSYRRFRAGWTLFDLDQEEKFQPEDRDWREINPHYVFDSQPVFIPAGENGVFSNRTVNAKRSLYRIMPDGLDRAHIIREVDGSISLFQFSADFEAAAFVNETFAQPPEIFLWRKGEGVTRLTQFNRAIAEKQVPSFREVIWKSKDGVSLQGWLLESPGREHNGKPLPLIAFVHGGPALAISNAFSGYFHAWPYPFELCALNGIAVFIPNYRGSTTFGPDYFYPGSLDGKPVDDIRSGVAHLIDEGVADPNRLAIAGHSHGAWLAPLVMTREKLFRAGSFAEGSQNWIVIYSMMPPWLNRELHDWDWGTSLYDDPQPYINASPDLHFNGLDTSVLFEAGAKSLAVSMMGSPKAAARAGMPAEFVVYPKTAHNPTLPRIQKEIATRNLDWFRFWLQDYEDPDPEKEEQYARWRKMRDERCGWDEPKDKKPTYCEYASPQETVH